MPKYEVELQKSERYFVTVQIEAEDETAAQEEAISLGYQDKVDWQWEECEVDSVSVDEVEEAKEEKSDA